VTPELALTIAGMVATALMVLINFVYSEARSRERIQSAMNDVAGVKSAISDMGHVLGEMRGETRVIHTKIESIEREVFKDHSGGFARPPRTGV
jgi:hypothetical protein